jgi:HSP20 family protein
MVPFFSREPFRALQEEFDDLINRFSANWGGESEGINIPAVDMSETDTSIEVRMDVPGMHPEDIDIEVMGNMLRVSGETQEEKQEEDKGRKFHRVERHFGSFSRTISLPCAVKQDEVDAELHDGLLTIALPKCEEAKSHKIQVKGGKALESHSKTRKDRGQKSNGGQTSQPQES